MSIYLILYGIGRAWIEGLRMDSLYIGSIRTSQLLSILLIVFGVCFILINYFLHKKGKIKSLSELQPYYQENLLSNKEKKQSQKIENFTKNVANDNDELIATKEETKEKADKTDIKKE